MKIVYILILITSVSLLSGCSIKLDTNDLTNTLERCDKNGGLKEVTLYDDSIVADVYCKDGAKFEVDIGDRGVDI